MGIYSLNFEGGGKLLYFFQLGKWGSLLALNRFEPTLEMIV